VSRDYGLILNINFLALLARSLIHKSGEKKLLLPAITTATLSLLYSKSTLSLIENLITLV